MKTHLTLKELVYQLLLKEIQRNPKTYADYITNQMEKRGTLETYLDLDQKTPEEQNEVITLLGYDPRTKPPLESLLEEAVEKDISLKEASLPWLKARLATRDKAHIRRGVEKLAHTIRWAAGKELQEKHIIWLKKCKKCLL